MLRKGTKENFIRILQDVLRLCERSLNREANILISALQESQDAVISVGTGLEKSVDNPMEIISKMESLCEAFYMLSINMENREVYGSQIKELLTEIIEKVSDLPVSYQIVFFPYKAEMWDSLESIWLACKDDPTFDCKVVPIPYYNFDAEQNQWKYHYELNRFPEYVPVVHYADYDLNEHADVAFVHNPYDEYNHVTHVHSDYYSYNLKKCVDKLFYVPYYVTSGFIAENHKSLSVYEHADYIVVQSESFKEGLKEKGYGHKALVMGSPKLDRVIRMNGNPDCVPEDWKSILEGKKSLMLNTSLGQFLCDGEIYLQKIARVVETVKKRDDVVLIWRPHPLLRSTIESMRPELRQMYEKLQEEFIMSGAGIIDTTPDITKTIAVVDGYIGEKSSSVVNLFEAVGKPVFILNNYITEDFEAEKKRQVLMFGCNKIGDEYYCTSAETSDLFVVEGRDWTRIRRVTAFEHAPKWRFAWMNNVVLNKKLYLTPYFGEQFYMFDVDKGQMKQLSSLNENMHLFYQNAIAYKNKVFYIPIVGKCIMEYDALNDRWKQYRKPIEEMQKGISEHIFEDVASHFVTGRYIWMSNLYSNCVICFDMQTAEYKKYEIGDPNSRYGAIAVDEERIYLSNAYTGEIQVWDYISNTLVHTYVMPKGYCIHANYIGRQIAHIKLWLVDEQLFVVPNNSNMLVKIDLVTKEISVVGKELWEDVFEPANNYHPMVNSVVCFSNMIDEHTLLIQKRRDASLIEVNTRTGEYHVYYPMLAEHEVDKMLIDEDGFEQLEMNGEFARRESRHFSLKGFLEDLIRGRLSKTMIYQKENMCKLAVNLDGTCGEKVYGFMRMLLKDNR